MRAAITSRGSCKEPRLDPVRRLESALNFPFYPGYHTTASPVLGQRTHEIQALQKELFENPILGDFERALCQSPENVYLLPLGKKNEADQFSRELYLNYIAKYGPPDKNEMDLVHFSYSGMPGQFSNLIYFLETEDERNTWRVQAVAEGRHSTANERHGCYLPPHIVAYHELMHIEEIAPRTKEIEYKNLLGTELIAQLTTIILLDEVYKKIDKLPEYELVDYKKEMDLGRIANFYRIEMQKQDKPLYQIVASPESLDFLKTINIKPASFNEGIQLNEKICRSFPPVKPLQRTFFEDEYFIKA